MSSTVITTPRAGVSFSFSRMFDALCRMAEATPIARAVDALNAESDADLVARGTTRTAEIRRIFAAHYY